MIKSIQYRTDDGIGEIVGVQVAGNILDAAPGLAAVAVLLEAEIRPGHQRYDAVRRVILDMTEAQRASAALPTKDEVEIRIQAELRATDAIASVDDYPIEKTDRADVALYRHALRALSDLPEHEAMIVAWPERPDGVDPISDLRRRLNAARAASK